MVKNRRPVIGKPDNLAVATATVRKIQESPLRNQLKTLENWSEAVENLANHYHQFGTGLFAQAYAFRWQNGKLLTINHPDPVHFSQLIGYENQRDLLLKNTEILLAGYPALNVLLYGSRGSGKSSLIKSLLHEYSDRGLRLIEVAKSDLKDLPLVVEQLRGVAEIYYFCR